MIKRLVGLAALGGFLYAHKKRGGTMTLDSFKDTARSLVDSAKSKAQDLKLQAEEKMREQRIGSSEGDSRDIGADVTGYGSSGYGYDTNIRR